MERPLRKQKELSKGKKWGSISQNRSRKPKKIRWSPGETKRTKEKGRLVEKKEFAGGVRSWKMA